MVSMSFVCDYAKISPALLMYKIDHSDCCFSTYKDVDEDKFILYVFPWDKNDVFSADDINVITGIINPYIFDPED